MAGGEIDPAWCNRIVDALDQEVLVFGEGGTLAYLNTRARDLVGDMPEDMRLPDLLAEIGEAGGRLDRIAQGGAWVPINLRIVRGDMAGLEMKFRGRGIRSADNRQPALMLMADRHRDNGFVRMRELVGSLNREVADKRKLNQRLEQALASENRLHGELIHRVKNNLALLGALISLRKRYSETEETKEALRDLELRINAIRAVHDILDRAGEIDEVQVGEVIRSLCRNLDRSILPDHITVKDDLLDISLPVEDATPLSLLVNELITNAIKHAFPDGREGTVHVSLKKNGVDKIEVNVADNGAGINDNGRKGSGSRIVEALARQIGGTLDQESDTRGTRWTFVFPYRRAKAA